MINGFVKCESCKHMIMLSEEQVDPGIPETEEEDLGYIPTPKEVGLRGISSVNESITTPKEVDVRGKGSVNDSIATLEEVGVKGLGGVNESLIQVDTVHVTRYRCSSWITR